MPSSQITVSNDVFKRLIDAAIKKSGPDILLCGKCKTFRDSVYEMGNYIVFWYNTPDQSTHTVREMVNN